MNFSILDHCSRLDISSLFTSVFSASEGEQEGQRVGNLAAALAARIGDQEIICIGAEQDGSLIGVIFFTPLQFDEPVQVCMLSPVAVRTSHQGKGVGQALIAFGLSG